MRQITIRRYVSHEQTFTVPEDGPQRAELLAYAQALEMKPNEWEYLPGSLSFIVMANRTIDRTPDHAPRTSSADRLTIAEEIERDLGATRTN